MDFFSRKNRILLKELVKTDFKLRYQGSLMGHLWSILKPMMLFAIMYVVFVHFLRMITPHSFRHVLRPSVKISTIADAERNPATSGRSPPDHSRVRRT